MTRYHLRACSNKECGREFMTNSYGGRGILCPDCREKRKHVRRPDRMERLSECNSCRFLVTCQAQIGYELATEIKKGQRYVMLPCEVTSVYHADWTAQRGERRVSA